MMHPEMYEYTITGHASMECSSNSMSISIQTVLNEDGDKPPSSWRAHMRAFNSLNLHVWIRKV